MNETSLGRRKTQLDALVRREIVEARVAPAAMMTTAVG